MWSLQTLCVLLYVVHASCNTVSTQVRLGETDYFLPPIVAWKLHNPKDHGISTDTDFMPLTVVQMNDTTDSSAIRATLDRYRQQDDVWTPSFANGRSSLN